MRAFSGLVCTVLAVFVGVGFKGIHTGSTLFVTVRMFGLPLLLAICCGFLICDPAYVLGLFSILVHHGLLM